MKIVETGIEDLLVIEPKVYKDERGYFFEVYHADKMPQIIAQSTWVQDNESKSSRGVLRGLHYQVDKYAQAKLVRAITGEVYDVVVDLRTNSKTYGEWFGIHLTEHNKKQLYIPRGFAHGFVVLSEEAIFSYKCDNIFVKDSEGGIRYNDVTLAINWSIDEDAIMTSEKDNLLPSFGNHRPLYS